MDVKIVKHSSYETTPGYAKEGDAGIDLKATSIIKNDDYQIVYGTGIAMEIPKGFVGLVYPRSSIRKKDLILANSVGVIDSGYRGEIQATFIKTASIDKQENNYEIGDRICQIIIMERPTINFIPVQKLQTSERGIKGHGSSGN